MARTAKLPHIKGGGKTGRPPKYLDWRIRRKHLEVAYARLVLGRSIKWCVANFGVSRRTVQYWCRAAKSYDDPEAQGLRDMIARGRP